MPFVSKPVFGNIDLQNNLGQVEGVYTNFGCEFFEGLACLRAVYCVCFALCDTVCLHVQ